MCKYRIECVSRSGRYILTAGGGLVVVGLTHQDGGLFECRAGGGDGGSGGGGGKGGRLLARYNVTVDTNRYLFYLTLLAFLFIY